MSPKLLNVFLILLPVSLYYGYIDPAYNGTPGLVWTPTAGILALQSQKVQYENSTAQLELIQSEIDKINKDYLGLDKNIKEKVGIMLPDTIDPFKLRNEVTTIANKANIAISGLKVAEIVVYKNPKLGGYKISFSARGDYASIKKLIEAYERNMRFFLVDNITINRYVKKDENGKSIETNDSTSETLLDLTISFNVYYLKS